MTPSQITNHDGELYLTNRHRIGTIVTIAGHRVLDTGGRFMTAGDLRDIANQLDPPGPDNRSCSVCGAPATIRLARGPDGHGGVNTDPRCNRHDPTRALTTRPGA